jgi:UDP-N-acetyl-2-amino-2-deoxyglucuronate dehydrogenase
MTLGVGIIGAGAISSSHAAAYSSNGRRIRLVGVADLDLDRARQVQRRFHADTAVADYRELLARPEVDLVSVCTPPATHAEITIDALEAGKHVLCEKPMTTAAEDAAVVARVASEHPELQMSCVFQHRDDPALRRARWVINEGIIGSIISARVGAHAARGADYYGEARGMWRTDGGGALMVQGIHLLDSLTWLLGEVESVSATTATLMHDIEAEDTAAGWARLASGGLVTIECDTCAHRDAYEMDIQGQLGSLHLRYYPGWGRAWRYSLELDRRHDVRRATGRARRCVRSPAFARTKDLARIATARAIHRPACQRRQGHGPHIARFLDAVESGTGAPVPAVEARRSVELVVGFYRSAMLGHPVHLAAATVERPVELAVATVRQPVELAAAA